jgi:hypothetical protein
MAPVTQDVTDQMVEDILTTAFEGGVNYWVYTVQPSYFPKGASYAAEVLTKPILDFSAKPVIVLRTFEGTEHTLTLELAQKGIAIAAQKREMSLNDFYEQHDAADADNVVQYALFDEIIYS